MVVVARDRWLVGAAVLQGVLTIAIYWVLLSHQTPTDYGVVPMVVSLIVASSLIAGATGWWARARSWGRTILIGGVVGLALMGFVGAASIGVLWLASAVLLAVAGRRITSAAH